MAQVLSGAGRARREARGGNYSKLHPFLPRILRLLPADHPGLPPGAEHRHGSSRQVPRAAPMEEREPGGPHRRRRGTAARPAGHAGRRSPARTGTPAVRIAALQEGDRPGGARGHRQGGRGRAGPGGGGDAARRPGVGRVRGHRPGGEPGRARRADRDRSTSWRWRGRRRTRSVARAALDRLRDDVRARGGGPEGVAAVGPARGAGEGRQLRPKSPTVALQVRLQGRGARRRRAAVGARPARRGGRPGEEQDGRQARPGAGPGDRRRGRGGREGRGPGRRRRRGSGEGERRSGAETLCGRLEALAASDSDEGEAAARRDRARLARARRGRRRVRRQVRRGAVGRARGHRRGTRPRAPSARALRQANAEAVAARRDALRAGRRRLRATRRRPRSRRRAPPGRRCRRLPDAAEARRWAARFEQACRAALDGTTRWPGGEAAGEKALQVCEAAERLADAGAFPRGSSRGAGAAARLAGRAGPGPGRRGRDRAVRGGRRPDSGARGRRRARSAPGCSQQNLARLQALCAELEAVATTEGLALKQAERALRDARAALDEAAPLPVAPGPRRSSTTG